MEKRASPREATSLLPGRDGRVLGLASGASAGGLSTRGGFGFSSHKEKSLAAFS